MYTLLFHIAKLAQTIDNIVWWVGYISNHFRNYHFRIAIHFWISFQLKVNTMAVESLKSDRRTQQLHLSEQ